MHATTSPKFVDQQPAALAALAAVVFAVGIALGAVMDLDLRIASTTSSIAAPDTSYNAVEGARAQLGVNADTSYNAVEGTRAQLGVEASKFGASGFPSSKTHDELRADGGWWASAPITAPAEQPERDGQFGHGYR